MIKHSIGYVIIVSLAVMWNMSLRNNNVLLMEDNEILKAQNKYMVDTVIDAQNELDYAETWRNDIAKAKFCPPPPIKG